MPEDKKAYRCSIGPAEGDMASGLPVNPAKVLREAPIKMVMYDPKPAARPMQDTVAIHASEGHTPVQDGEYYKSL